MSNHAMVQRDGFMVPLIGVPESAVLETCDLCGDTIGLTGAVMNGSQVICQKCDSPNKE